MSKTSPSERLPFAMMLAAIFAGGVGYGIFAKQNHAFPVPQINAGLAALRALKDESQRKWFLSLPGQPDRIEPSPDHAGGAVMLVGVEDGPRNMVRIVDRAGQVMHQYSPDWFRIWAGDEGAFPAFRRPKSQPGAILHGALLMKNGDIVVNFEHLSTLRLNACNETVWKLDNLGHHSLFHAHDGTLWASAERYVTSGDTGQANIKPPYHAWSAQQISPEGKILRDIDITRVLARNGLSGLLHLGTLDNLDTAVRGDTLHLNDIEVFPPSAQSPIFTAGDLMISLRNISTVLVIDPDSLAVKWRATGSFLRQHDPDFMDDGRIILFDNNNTTPAQGQGSSRILILDPVTNTQQVVVEGAEDMPFYTAIMGKQQVLPGGHVMVTSSLEGRAFEIDDAGRQVWAYNNQVSDGYTALLTEATVLPQWADTAFFEAARARCAAP